MPTPLLQVGSVTVKGGNYGSFSWPQTLGLEAPRVVWQFAPLDASAILAGPQEVTILMRDSSGVEKKIQRVYVVGEEHSPDALVRSVIFSDVRFYLSYGYLRSSYNVLVESGTLFQPTAYGIPSTALNPVAAYTFGPYSLHGSDSGPVGTRWNAQEIALDVLQKACSGQSYKPIAFRNLARDRSSFIPNNVYVDTDAKTAVGQILGPLGGLDIRVADDGAVELVDAYMGAERATCDPIVASYSLERKGVLRWISMANVAPESGTILVTRRCEVRADSWEAQPDSGGNRSDEGDDVVWGTDNNPTMINVIRVTDQNLPVSLPVTGLPTSSPVGSYLPASQWFADVADLNTPTGSGIPAPVPFTRQWWLAGVGGAPGGGAIFSNTAESLFVSDQGTGQGPSIIWGNRFGALRNDFRQTYKLNPVLAKQCVPGSIRAERAALLDPVTATRQPATVYFDYLQRPLGPGMAKEDHYGWNVSTIPGAIVASSGAPGQFWPDGIKGYTDPGPYQTNPFHLQGPTITGANSVQAAPFSVECIDSSTGIFHFAPLRTPDIRHGAQTTPGMAWGIPVITFPGLVEQAKITPGLAIASWDQAKALLTHRVALIFSATPAGPNNASALQQYKVSVATALQRLGAPANSVQARGPAKSFRIRDPDIQAFMPWSDDLRSQILGCFSVTNQTSPTAQLVPVNNPQLQDYAEAIFTVYMSAVLDHYEGTMQIGFSPKVMPSGSLRQVSHQFLPDGTIYTTLRADGVVPTAAPESIISQASRKVLFRGLA